MLIVYRAPWKHKMCHNWPSSLLHWHAKWWNGSTLQASLPRCWKRIERLKSYFAKSKGFSLETTTEIDDSAQCSSSIVKTVPSVHQVSSRQRKALLVLMMPQHLWRVVLVTHLFSPWGDSVPQSITTPSGGCPMDEIQDTWVIHNNRFQTKQFLSKVNN